MLIPGYLKRLTIAYYLQGLVPHAMPQDDSSLSILRAVDARGCGPDVAAWLAVIWLAFLVVAAWTVSRRGYVLEQ